MKERMKDKLLLVGSGGFGRVVSEHATLDYDCAFADDGHPIGSEICGITVVGTITDLPRLRLEYPKLVVAIGNNLIRETIYRQAQALGYQFPNIIARSAYVSPYAELGWGCVLLNHVTIQNGSRLGNGVLLNMGVGLHHNSYVDDFSLIYTNSVIRTGAKVGKRVKIGSTVTVGNRSIVPDDAVIPDGAAVIMEQQEREG